MNELKIFTNEQFGKVRTIEINGEPHFVASDVAKALGYKKPDNAIKQHCRYALKQGIPHPQNETKTLEVNCIPIGDVFRLGTHSELPGADQFESWIYDEVLPTLHKTGKYEMPKSKAQMTDYQKTMTKTRLENTKIRKAQLLTKLANQYKGTTYEQVLNSYATKELTGEHILPLPVLERKTYSATEIGNILGVSANMIGRLSKKHNLKTEQYGKWFHDKAKYSAKEVPTFRYYDNVIPVLKEIINQEVA